MLITNTRQHVLFILLIVGLYSFVANALSGPVAWCTALWHIGKHPVSAVAVTDGNAIVADAVKKSFSDDYLAGIDCVTVTTVLKKKYAARTPADKVIFYQHVTDLLENYIDALSHACEAKKQRDRTQVAELSHRMQCIIERLFIAFCDMSPSMYVSVCRAQEFVVSVLIGEHTQFDESVEAKCALHINDVSCFAKQCHKSLAFYKDCAKQ